MRYKMLMVVFSSTLLLALATGTAWANDPIVAAVKIPLGQPAPIVQEDVAASGAIKPNCTRVATLCAAGTLDATLPQEIATHDVQIATVELSFLFQHPAARSTRDLSLVSPGPGWASPLLAIENSTNSTHVRTGIFPGAKEKSTTKRPMDQVQTGVFWSPQEFSGKAQGFSIGNVPRLGFGEVRDGRGVENGALERQSIQGQRPRKRGTGPRLGPRQGR
jgi:hypothetical protein